MLSASHDADSGTLSHAWDLNGDGIFETTGDGPQSVSFSSSGLHTVRLRTTDSDGLASTTEHAIAVVPSPTPPGVPPVTPPALTS